MTTPQVFRAPLSRGARQLLQRYYEAEMRGGSEPSGDGRHVNALYNFMLIEETPDDPSFRYRITETGKAYINPETDKT